MEINIDFENFSNNSVQEGIFFEVAEKILKEKAAFLENKKISLSLSLVDKEEIKKLNDKHRNKDVSTDVLSFSEFEGLDEIKADDSKDIFLGEIILCYDDIKEYSKEEGIVFARELIKVFSHGLLHLLGFSHGEEMFSYQENISDLFLKKYG